MSDIAMFSEISGKSVNKPFDSDLSPMQSRELKGGKSGGGKSKRNRTGRTNVIMSQQEKSSDDSGTARREYISFRSYLMSQKPIRINQRK